MTTGARLAEIRGCSQKPANGSITGRSGTSATSVNGDWPFPVFSAWPDRTLQWYGRCAPNGAYRHLDLLPSRELDDRATPQGVPITYGAVGARIPQLRRMASTPRCATPASWKGRVRDRTNLDDISRWRPTPFTLMADQ